jgi:hypothetical protein
MGCLFYSYITATKEASHFYKSLKINSLILQANRRSAANTVRLQNQLNDLFGNLLQVIRLLLNQKSSVNLSCRVATAKEQKSLGSLELPGCLVWYTFNQLGPCPCDCDPYGLFCAFLSRSANARRW